MKYAECTLCPLSYSCNCDLNIICMGVVIKYKHEDAHVRLTSETSGSLTLSIVNIALILRLSKTYVMSANQNTPHMNEC